MQGAGTDANVYITIYGERGDTGKRKLLSSNNENKFEIGQVTTVLSFISKFKRFRLIFNISV